MRALLCVVACALTTPAHAEVDWAGRYSAGPMQIKAEVTTWGEDCGPRPQSSTEASKANVVVATRGKQLTLTFPDRTVRSEACWSPNPAVRVASASAKDDRWRVECKTPPGDAKRERGVYTLSARVVDEHALLELVEESSYDWQLKQSHCVAKVRITQSLSRGGVIPAATPAPAAPEPVSSCSTPGPLARVRLRPSSARIAPGEKQCFTVRGLDAAGCGVQVDGAALAWELDKPSGATGSLSGGCFKAAGRAAEAEGRFTVSVRAGGLRDQAAIEVTTADLSDITARRGSGASDLDVSEDSEGLTSASGIEAAVKRSSLAVKLALTALLLAFIGALAWWTLGRKPQRKRKRKRRPVSDDEDGETHAPRHSTINSLAPGGGPEASLWSGSGEQMICPTCRRGVPVGVDRCPTDGSVPVPYSEFVRSAQASEGKARTCSACGAQLAAGALFCGVCGAKVRS
jgi:hypothetical protein